MTGRGDRGRLLQPGRSTEQLYGHRVARINTFHFDGKVDQTIGFHHGGENA